MVKYDGSCYIAVDLTIVKQAPSSSSGSDEGSGDEEPPEPTAQTIAVSGLKESYTAGDSINQDELTVSVTFSDGTTKKLGKDVDCHPFARYAGALGAAMSAGRLKRVECIDIE